MLKLLNAIFVSFSEPEKHFIHFVRSVRSTEIALHM